jgi:putative cell wall-binding protein
MGYVLDSGVKFLNQSKGISKTQPSLTVRAGSNRYSTAVEISKSKFSQAETVVLVNGYSLVDGLASTPLAAYYNSPLLLTQTNTLGSDTKAEIQRLQAKNVIIVGGSGVVTSKVVNELNAMGISNITRLGGNNRFDTALEVAKYIDQNLYDVSNVVIASGFGEADAMSIAPVSGRDRMPILLVQKDNIPESVLTWLSSEGLESAYIIGGTGVVSDNVMSRVDSITSKSISSNRLGGSSRYETNALIIERFYPEALDTVILSKGIELVDALAVGPLAALNNYPVVLAGTDLTGEQKYVLGKRTATRVYQAGYGVSKTAISSLRKSLAYYKY